MAISNYGELKTAVANWLARSDLTPYLDDFVKLGEMWIYRHARTREMEASLSVTIANGVAQIPGDFLELKNARVSGSPTTPLEIRPVEWIYATYPVRSGGSLPKFIGIDGSTFVFGPYPSDYTIVGTYYANLGSIDSTTHALFTAAPDLYLFAALAEAEPFLKNDERMLMWIARRDAALRDINNAAKRSRFASGMSVRLA